MEVSMGFHKLQTSPDRAKAQPQGRSQAIAQLHGQLRGEGHRVAFDGSLGVGKGSLMAHSNDYIP